nr:MAG TPA: hypothetical protein [Caudoviricetes sp.]
MRPLFIRQNGWVHMEHSPDKSVRQKQPATLIANLCPA